MEKKILTDCNTFIFNKLLPPKKIMSKPILFNENPQFIEKRSKMLISSSSAT